MHNPEWTAGCAFILNNSWHSLLVDLFWIYRPTVGRKEYGMKTVKEGEVRRREILVATRELFVKKGYEQTSVNDILKIVDIAKW